jgi:hypothetical protein
METFTVQKSTQVPHISPPAATLDADMHKVCTHCNGPFGMIRHRWWSEAFCSEKCRKAFLEKIAAERCRMLKWLDYLKPPSVPLA